MNDGESNFSLIRNGEINRLGPKHIMPHFYRNHDVHRVMEEAGAAEPKSYIYEHSMIWTRGEDYQHKHINSRVSVDHHRQALVIGLDAFKKPEVEAYLQDPETEVILLDNCGSIETLTDYLDEAGYSDVKCWSLPNEPCNDHAALLKYFEYLCKSCEDVVIVE